jgi:hypothetical protein
MLKEEAVSKECSLFFYIFSYLYTNIKIQCHEALYYSFCFTVIYLFLRSA